jgi:hypothetical protein
MTYLPVLIVALTTLAGAAAACPSTEVPAPAETFTGDELYAPRSTFVDAGGKTSLNDCVEVTGERLGDGYFRSDPDLTFELSGLEGYTLDIRARPLQRERGCDVELLVHDASGTWTYDGDLEDGPEARVNLAEPIDGRLDVWVGSYTGAVCDAVLTLETLDR